MTSRTDMAAASPALFKAWYAFATLVGECGIEKSLLELVKIRASHQTRWLRLVGLPR